MARIPRILITGDPTAYHIISRSALDGFPIDAVEKDYFTGLLVKFSRLYFTDILGFCCMDNHFHLLVRMRPDSEFSDAQIKRRFVAFYGNTRPFAEGQIPFLRQKWASLSEFVREIKLGFTRFYNKRHGRRGYFWGDRFKSVVVQDGQTLINCLAYIDLNPVRAGLVKRPEDYRWSSIGYHIQQANKAGLLSLDLGLNEFGRMGVAKRLQSYRRFLYESGAVATDKGAGIDAAVVAKERRRDFVLPPSQRLLYRSRYFSDAGIIGTQAYVSRTYRLVKNHFQAKHEKIPKPISGLVGIYSLKRLSEPISSG